MKTIVFLILATFLLTGCFAHGPYGPSHAGIGTVGGAMYGGLMGALIGGDERSAWTGAGIGAVGGYILGNEVDKSYYYHSGYAPQSRHYSPAPSTFGGFFSGNPGVQSSYHRGVSNRLRADQRQLERDAYNLGRRR